LEIKVAELTAQLEATVENPQLIRRYDLIHLLSFLYSSTVHRYEDTVAQLETAKQKLAAETAQFNSAETSLLARIEAWEQTVNVIARKLNTLFSKYMSELQYRGSVELVRQGSLQDYEMQMSVSFRQNLDLAKLSGQRHSGGERAVSTVMYLMALQDLTSAPFRVVDEINQVCNRLYVQSVVCGIYICLVSVVYHICVIGGMWCLYLCYICGILFICVIYVIYVVCVNLPPHFP
jgi:hypothetical protein